MLGQDRIEQRSVQLLRRYTQQPGHGAHDFEIQTRIARCVSVGSQLVERRLKSVMRVQPQHCLLDALGLCSRPWSLRTCVEALYLTVHCCCCFPLAARSRWEPLILRMFAPLLIGPWGVIVCAKLGRKHIGRQNCLAFVYLVRRSRRSSVIVPTY